ncbi:MAG: flavin reductase family protein [Deltaproteobacteria bacterium]|nr:flavin reductase family protein [Deltaproteobacteria bacterium]
MDLKTVAVDDFCVRAHSLWARQWLVLTSGDFAAGDYNAMTVGWGSFGTMWGKPFAQVVVRPSRYTFEFIEKYDTFTLCALPADYRKALNQLGSQSGRDGDKIAEAGLTPVAGLQAAAPGYAEAELIVECRKLYGDDFDSSKFIDPSIADSYSAGDYHRSYYGEILTVRATDAYCCS